jgi:hypothetical protein
MDNEELAQMQEAKWRDLELARRIPEEVKLIPNGICRNNCGAEAKGIFCCPECKEDFETRVRLKKQNGKR